MLGPSLGASALPAESPIPSLIKNASYSSMTPAKPGISSNSKVTLRRRTMSDYRTEPNNSVKVDSNSAGKAVLSIKNATKTLASGLSKFTAKRMVSNYYYEQLSKHIVNYFKFDFVMMSFQSSIGIRPSSSKENKQT